jgi:hypothetical protein
MGMLVSVDFADAGTKSGTHRVLIIGRGSGAWMRGAGAVAARSKGRLRSEHARDVPLARCRRVRGLRGGRSRPQ